MDEQQIHLEKITYDNVMGVCKLRITKEQKNYVADNRTSLIEAFLALDRGDVVYPFAIYHAKTLVGFVMIGYDNDWTGYEHEAWLASDEYHFYEGKPYYYLWRFMIDKRYQGRGYGRAALERVIDFVKTHPCGDAEYCVLSYEPCNEAAKRLYFSVGFHEINGPDYYEEGDEVSAVLKL